MTDQQNVESGGEQLRFSDLLLEEMLAGIALVIVVSGVAWGVITRYITSAPAAWSGELATIAFAWLVFLGSAAVFRRSGHIMIDSLLRLLPVKLSRAVQVIAAVVVLITLISLTALASSFTLETMDVPTTILRLPQAVVYASAALGFFLMAVRHAAATWEKLSTEEVRP
ncbi:TRAP transporter small permease [Pseudomonas daroniae]|uniref:TRAP transporter small permease protein n=1 Tax=Phytopseudomonas daroniae TaxID=2487519 RepID=A0A4Q9QRK1_9GAMM|nr:MULTISPECIES: TRAP transporter small permease [Pseudomonas]TBU83469.1 TRAP transporter small permease [Pseudomonas daroniae]TBU85108.1 TRAP transporter small permease [Pseudomonas sp. FRB 228]TBU93599.1 TRAP transporter small permease [Pseudomonas daroniae]